MADPPLYARRPVKALCFMLTSAALFAVLNLLIKFLAPSLRVWDITMYRYGGGFLIMLLFWGRRAGLFRPRQPKLILLRGITGTTAFVLLVSGLGSIPLSTAMVLFYCFPAFAALFSALFFKEGITYIEVLCIVVALIGVAVIFDFRLEGEVLGQILVVLAAVFAGLTIAIIRKLRESHGSVIIYFYFCLIGSAVSFVPFITRPQLPGNMTEWLIVAGIIVTSIVAQLSMNMGFGHCKSWEGGLFMTSEVIFATILGILFLSEQIGWRFWTGGSIIIASAALINLKDKIRLSKTVCSPPRAT